MLQTLHKLKRADSYSQEAFSIENIIVSFRDRVKNMAEDANKNKGKEILKIVNKILKFNLNQQKQKGQGLKILPTNQMLSRLPISLAQLKAGNNSEGLKMKLGNFCILFTDQRTYKNIYKSLIDII